MNSINTFALALIAACTLAPALRSQQPLPPQPGKVPLELGAAWYPEQWPESRWDADLTLMEQAHIHFVRVGEFAWSTLEPSEGVYKLDWLDHAIRAAERHHIAVVIGTPTAAPPAWLTQKYPQTLRTMEDGRKDDHGNRQQFDFAGPKYRELCRIIATKLAERFGHDPDVIGWQIDNEYAADSVGPDDRAQFDDWLHARYKTLDNLNTRWTTAYWSQTYSAWDQINIPRRDRAENPGLNLAWREFVSDTWRSYQRNQLDAIRAHADARQFITTNMMGWFDAFDQYTVAQDLDLASWDDYVGSGQLNFERNGATHDLTRGFLRKNFWVMETQPGFVNWHSDNNALNKGEVRAMAWNAIGHGSEAVEYWQWRSALNGQEQYHGTLVGADGMPVPLYTEVEEIGTDFDKAGPALAGTTVHSDVALLNNYPSRWAIDWQRHNKAFDPIDAFMSFYTPLHDAVRSVDVVQDTDPLEGYKLVVAPALNVITPAAAKNLEAYVRNGGHLVLGPRSGMKDEDNSLWPERQPGPLASLLGARVDEFYALDTRVPLSGDWGEAHDSLWAEYLTTQSPDTQVLMRYGKSNGWLDFQAAAVTRRVGKGSITYIGASLDPAALKRAAAWMLSNAGLAPVLPNIPEGVDVGMRSGDNKSILILTNYNAASVTIPLPSTMHDVLAGTSTRSVTLPQYGVAVLEQ
jgi:beta-galactosidase